MIQRFERFNDPLGVEENGNFQLINKATEPWPFLHHFSLLENEGGRTCPENRN